MSNHVLIFAEDPGAANYLAALPDALALRGVTARLLTAGSATSYLRERGVVSEIASEIVSHASRPSAGDILQALRPGLVIVGTSENPDTLGLRLVAAARQRHIPTMGVVDAPMNAAYRFCGRTADPLAFAPDWLLVTDAGVQAAYHALGFCPHHVLVCGHPHYDAVRAARRRLAAVGRSSLRQSLCPQARPHQKIIVFVGESSTGIRPSQYRRSADYTLAGDARSDGRTEIVLDEFLSALDAFSSRPYLVLRLHPKSDPMEFARYAPAFDLVCQHDSVLQWLALADCAVGLTSAALQEAVLLGTPTLSILPRDCERGWLPTIAAGLTPAAHTRADLRRLIALPSTYTPPDPNAVNHFHPADSLPRVVNAVNAMMERIAQPC